MGSRRFGQGMNEWDVIMHFRASAALRMVAVLCSVGALAPAMLVEGAWAQTGLSPDGQLTVTAAANSEIQDYMGKASGRFGALAVAQDGSKTVSYICQSRLWKNCDEPGNEDSNIAIPSGKIARDVALTRCRSQTGSACIILFINDDQQREFAVQP